MSVEQRRCHGGELGLADSGNGRAWPAGEVLLAVVTRPGAKYYLLAIPQAALGGEALTGFLGQVAPFGCPVPGSLVVNCQEIVSEAHPGRHCEAGGCQTTITAMEEARMDIHQNARSTPRSRAEIVRRVLARGQRPARVAAAVGVSERTVRKWVARYQAQAEAGLRDRSCRPHRTPTATPPLLVRWAERLRRQR